MTISNSLLSGNQNVSTPSTFTTEKTSSEKGRLLSNNEKVSSVSTTHFEKKIYLSIDEIESSIKGSLVKYARKHLHSFVFDVIFGDKDWDFQDIDDLFIREPHYPSCNNSCKNKEDKSKDVKKKDLEKIEKEKFISNYASRYKYKITLINTAVKNLFFRMSDFQFIPFVNKLERDRRKNWFCFLTAKESIPMKEFCLNMECDQLAIAQKFLPSWEISSCENQIFHMEPPKIEASKAGKIFHEMKMPNSVRVQLFEKISDYLDRVTPILDLKDIDMTYDETVQKKFDELEKLLEVPDLSITLAPARPADKLMPYIIVNGEIEHRIPDPVSNMQSSDLSEEVVVPDCSIQ